jgi:hypothetical protein
MVNRPPVFTDDYFKAHGGMEVKLHIFFTSTLEKEGPFFLSLHITLLFRRNFVLLGAALFNIGSGS